jgi:hypothetical protein
MPRSPFFACERELKLLQDQWQSSQARLMILSGRWRVGKTRLVTHWIEHSGMRALYWVAVPTSSRDQLASLSQALYNFETPAPAPDNFTAHPELLLTASCQLVLLIGKSSTAFDLDGVLRFDHPQKRRSRHPSNACFCVKSSSPLTIASQTSYSTPRI